MIRCVRPHVWKTPCVSTSTAKACSTRSIEASWHFWRQFLPLHKKFTRSVNGPTSCPQSPNNRPHHSEERDPHVPDMNTSQQSVSHIVVKHNTMWQNNVKILKLTDTNAGDSATHIVRMRSKTISVTLTSATKTRLMWCIKQTFLVTVQSLLTATPRNLSHLFHHKNIQMQETTSQWKDSSNSRTKYQDQTTTTQTNTCPPKYQSRVCQRPDVT